MQEDTQKRMVRYLNDAHAMEAGAVVSLQDIANRVSDFEVKQTMNDLVQIAKTQIERLTQRIRAYGGSVAVQKDAFNSALAKGHRITNAFHDQADKETQDVIKAYTASYLEIGAYTSMAAYARAIGDMETAQLADTLIEEERRAGERLQPLISRLAVVPAFSQMSQSTTYSGETSGKSKLGGWVLPVVLLSGTALTVWAMRNKQDGGSAYPSDTSYGNDMGYSNSRTGDTPMSGNSFRQPTEADLDTDETIEIIDVVVVDRTDADDQPNTGSTFTTSSGSGTGSSSSI